MQSWIYMYRYYGLKPYIENLLDGSKIVKLENIEYCWYSPEWTFEEDVDLLDFLVKNLPYTKK